MSIWYPSHSHKGGTCRVDISWFNGITFAKIAKKYPNAKVRTPDECGDPKHMAACCCIELPEKLEIDKYHIFEFRGGIPFEMRLMPIKPSKVIMFKRNPVKKDT